MTLNQWKNFYRATIKPACYENALEQLQQGKARGGNGQTDYELCIAAVQMLIAERGKK